MHTAAGFTAVHAPLLDLVQLYSGTLG
eukprot:COSAG02_NODE_17245_length_1018_cov_1.509249_1_plen_26_part_10